MSATAALVHDNSCQVVHVQLACLCYQVPVVLYCSDDVRILHGGGILLVGSFDL